MQITSGIIPSAKKVCLYGPEGIGKSTFASKFPSPVVYIDTEGSTKHMDVLRTPAPSSWAMLVEQVRHFISHPDQLATLVLDTADWAERLSVEALCARAHVDGLEGFSYGKGYVYLQEDFGKLLDLLSQLVDKGVHVVITAHAQMRKFEEPNEAGAYDRWELKLSKKVAPMVKEWADMLLFANYKVNVVNVDGQGAAKGKNKAQGGRRVMYTTHHPCWDAKNRFGLPEEMPFDYAGIAHLFATGQSAAASRSAGADGLSALGGLPGGHPGEKEASCAGTGPDPKAFIRGAAPQPLVEPSASGPRAGLDGLEPSNLPAGEAGAAAPGAMTGPGAVPGAEQGRGLPPGQMNMEIASAPPAPAEADAGRMLDVDGGPIPPALEDLMRSGGVSAQEIRAVVADRGYFPADMPIRDYAADFIKGCLIGAWPQVRQMVQTYRENLPF